jgi:signal transduction histidine kinase
VVSSSGIEAAQRRRRRIRDLAVPAGLVVLALIQLTAAPHENHRRASALAVALVVAVVFPLVWRRRWPLAVSAISAVPLIVFLALDFRPTLVVVAPLIGLFYIGLRGDRSVTVTVGIVAVVVGTVAIVAVAGGSFLQGRTLTFAAVLAFPLAVGDAVASRRAYVAELVYRAERAEQTREEEAERRVEQERLRIARELHDVVAHTISTINIQAGVAKHLLGKDPAQAEVALGAIKDASSDALAELRSMLGVLRSSDAPLQPAPGLDDVSDLIADMRAAGLDVQLEVTGERPPGLDDALQLAAYRIIQEACTNVIRHAGSAPTCVQIAYRSRSLELAVRNAPPALIAARPATQPGATAGIAGMRERVGIVGGRLSTGQAPDGGFEVRAEIPYRGASSTT